MNLLADVSLARKLIGAATAPETKLLAGSDQLCAEYAVIGDEEVREPTHEVTSCTCAIARSYSRRNKHIYNQQGTQRTSPCIVKNTNCREGALH